MKKQTAFAFVVLLTLAGFALRLYRLDAVPFRGDEAFTAQNWAGQPLALSLTEIATIEPHPPLTYVLFRAWGVSVGINEFTLRLLPALINLLGIPALYALGYHLGGRKVGVLAATLWAINPFEIWHSQDARNYAIWAGFSVLGLWLGLCVLKHRKRLDWWLYFLVALTTALIFYNELLMLAALSLYVLIMQWRDKRFLLSWFVVQGIIAAVVLLTFWVLQGGLFAAGGYGGTVGSFNAAFWPTWFLPTLIFGETLLPDWTTPTLIVWLPLLLVILASIGVLWRQNTRLAIFVVVIGGFPLLLLGVVSLKMNIFHPRYVIAAVPAFLLAIAGLWDWLSSVNHKSILRRGILGLLVCLCLGASGTSLYHYHFVPDYRKSQDWAALTHYLAAHVSADDLVIQTSVDAAFGYYYDAPAEDIGLPANPQESREAIIATLEYSREHYHSIWVVGRTFADWPNFGIVEKWVQENMQPVLQTQTAGLPIRQFMTWDVHLDELTETPITEFSNTAQLVGMHIVLPPEASSDLTVWLYWQPIKATQTPLKIFVHLLGEINPATQTPLWTQDDQYPQDGRISTQTWLTGEIYRDIYTLPLAAVPQGAYALEVGLYDPETGMRILTEDGADSHTIVQLSLP